MNLNLDRHLQKFEAGDVIVLDLYCSRSHPVPEGIKYKGIYVVREQRASGFYNVFHVLEGKPYDSWILLGNASKIRGMPQQLRSWQQFSAKLARVPVGSYAHICELLCSTFTKKCKKEKGRVY